MAQQTREQVKWLRSWWRQPVNPVPHLQQHQKGSVLRTLRVGVVQLENQILDALRVKVHAVSKHFQSVDLHIPQVGCLVVQVQRFVEESFIHRWIICDDATSQVDVHCFKEGLPFAAQRQCPVVALCRNDSVQSSSLPVREVRLVHWHEPALGVTSSKRIHINRRHGLQCRILSRAYLERNPHQHVDEVGLIFVALQCQQHPLPPGWIEPASQADVVADVDGVDLYSAVQSLKQVFHLKRNK